MNEVPDSWYLSKHTNSLYKPLPTNTAAYIAFTCMARAMSWARRCDVG
jgi:hypothetical protein